MDEHSIHDAISIIDSALNKNPLCYMANCVHPKMLKHALQCNETTLARTRFKGIQANVAYLPPKELDNLPKTISSSAYELTNEMISIDNEFPLKIYGGCCGTDDTHIREIAKYLYSLRVF